MILRKKWPVLLGISFFCLILSYFICSRVSSVYGFKIITIIYGSIGLLLIVILILYNIRKKLYGLRLGPTHSWLLAHIYIGIFSTFIIVAHSNTRVFGTFSSILFILFFIVITSGIVGLLIYKNIPLALSKFGRDVLTLDEIKIRISELQTEAEKSISGMSAESKKFYEKLIKPKFISKRTKWEYLIMEERAVINKQNKTLEKYIDKAPDNEVYTIKLLITPVTEMEKLKFMQVKIKLLKTWLNFHTPLTGAMFTALIIHIISTIYF